MKKNQLIFPVMENGEMFVIEIVQYVPTGLKVRIDDIVYRHCDCKIQMINSEFKGIAYATYYLPENNEELNEVEVFKKLDDNAENEYVDIKQIYKDTIAKHAFDHFMSFQVHNGVVNLMAAYKIFQEIKQKYWGRIEKLKKTYEEMLLYSESKISEFDIIKKSIKKQFVNNEISKIDYKKELRRLSRNKLIKEVNLSEKLRQLVYQSINELPSMKRLKLENGHFQPYYDILIIHIWKYLSNSEI